VWQHSCYIHIVRILFLLVTYVEYTYIAFVICVLVIIPSSTPGSIRAKFSWLVAAYLPYRGIGHDPTPSGSLHKWLRWFSNTRGIILVATGSSTISVAITRVSPVVQQPPWHYSISFTRPCWRLCVGYSILVLDIVKDVSCVVSGSTVVVKECSSGCRLSLRWRYPARGHSKVNTVLSERQVQGLIITLFTCVVYCTLKVKFSLSTPWHEGGVEI